MKTRTHFSPIEILESRTRPHRCLPALLRKAMQAGAKRCGRDILSSIEPLEARIAPAMVTLHVVDPHTATYTDTDGDLVTIKISVGTLAANGSDFVGTASGMGDQLQVLDLNGGGFDGSNVTFSIVKKPTGDGLVNVGYIDSTGHDLGNVIVPGDLGQIDAGDGNADTALAALSVKSLGLFGKATQLGGGSLTSDISGPLGTLKIATDVGRGVQIVVDATVEADGTLGSATIGGNFAGSILASGDVTSVKITGDLVGGQVFSSGKLKAVAIGGSVFGNAVGGDGLIAAGEIGTVTIGRDLVAGDQEESGKIDSFGKIASVTIGGSIIGGSGDENTVTLGGIIHAGQIFAVGDIGLVKVGHDVRGGSGDGSAKIVTRGKLSALTVGGSVIGGSGSYDSPTDIDDGQIFAALGMGPVNIGRDVQGGAGKSSALILSDGALTSATIGGSILGGGGESSGGLSATGATGMIKIGHDVHGGAGMNSGHVFSTGKIVGVAVGGSLLGGSQIGSGAITSDTEITVLKIVHNVAGGAGIASGVVANARSVSIGGSLIGGSGKFSGDIGGLNLASLTIGHDVLGGSNAQTGVISGDHIGSVVIHGSLVGGTSSFTASITSTGNIDALTIGGNFVGGSISGAASLDISGFVEALGRIGSITINGSIIAGIDDSTGALTNSAHIRASDDIGSLTVHGSLIGRGDAGKGASRVVISARGQHQPLAAGATTDVAIGKISIGGRVEDANVFAGYERDHVSSPTVLLATNADAQIGPVTVGGDWIASNLIAGAMNDAGTAGTTDDNINFGDFFNDKKITGGTDATGINSRIASITIAGQVFGSPASEHPLDHFGFVAEQVGALKIGTHTFVLQGGIDNDGRIVAATQDVTLHEISALIGSSSPAPSSAKLVNSTTVTYTDTDDDHVTVKLSKPLLTAGNVNNVFKFDIGMVNDGVPARQQLQLIDLAQLATNNIGVTVTVVPAGNGDGLANVGAITFTGFNAGAISVPGDVGEIAGGANNASTPGLASLNVRTIGRLGLDAQPAAFGAFFPKLGGEINGGIGSLTVTQDIIGALIDVTGPIGPMHIGGSLIGGGDVNSGLIATDATIGAVNFGHDIEGSAAQGSGRISGNLGITSITLGGSLLGGSGDGSGKIIVSSAMGAVKILGPVKIADDLIGGSGFGAGQIVAGDSSPMPILVGKITSVMIGGSLLGGANTSSGLVFSTGDLGAVTIAHDLRGGSGGNAGGVSTFGKIAGVTVGGSLVGGSNGNTGRIVSAGDMGTVKIGHDLLGGLIGPSATITSGGKLGAVTIGNSLVGGAGSTSASITSGGDLTALTIGGNLLGGGGVNSGRIAAGDPAAMPVIKSKILNLTIGGSMVGGSNLEAGRIYTTGGLGPIKIGGNIMGGSGQHAGSIFTDDKAGDITLGGSLVGGPTDFSGEMIAVVGFGKVTIGGDVAGGAGSHTGRIGAENKVTSITIHGSLVGGSNTTSTNLIETGIIDTSNDIGLLKIDGNVIGGSVSSTGALGASGYVESHGRIVNVLIGGSMISGVDHSASVDLFANASIRATTDIPTFTVKGSLIGNTTANGISPVIISADAEEDHHLFSFAIGKFTVNGSVEHATIFGDYTVSLVATADNAQIGMVKVGRNWIASNVVVGVVNSGANGTPGDSDDNINFGDMHDQALSLGPITHRIARVIIGGTVAGTDAVGDHFGFTAAVIGAFKYAGFTAPAYTVPIELSLPTGDVTVREAL